MASGINDNERLMRELISVIGGGTDRLESQYRQLLYKRDRALESEFGNDKAYMASLTSAIKDVEDAINSQKKAVESFYEEMKNLAGGDSALDPNELKEILKYRVEYMNTRDELASIRKLLEAEQKKTTNRNDAEIKRYENLIIKLTAELEKHGNDLRNKFGVGTLADLQIINFTSGDKVYDPNAPESSIGSASRKPIEDAIEASQRAQTANIWEMRRAEEANNRELKRTAEKWKTISSIVRAVSTQIKTGANYWLKYNEQAISDAKRLGIVSKEAALAYQNALMQNSKELSRNFGMTAEQAMKMQDVYSKVTGRAALLTKSQMEDIAASSKLMGDETVQSAIKMMDSIGTTSQSTTELLDKNFARAVNSGLDTVKASEEFVKNMSLANRLTFRNGVDGISKMTIMSQTIRMNLQEVANVADKFSTIEGAIEGAAQLQMLGGPVAMLGGNPMQMLQESLANPEALFERMRDMASTQAVFNRTTGEAEIDPLTLAFMKEQEKALGVSAGTLIGSAKQQAKIREIESEWSRYQPSVFQNASPEARAAIANRAEYDKEKGSWVVKYFDDSGKEVPVDIRDITQQQLGKITESNIEPVEDIRKRVREIAGELIGTRERWNSMKDQWRTSVGQMIDWFMRTGDAILTGVNGLLLWKAFTSGSFIATGVGIAGQGLYAGGKTWFGPKAARKFKNLLFGRKGGGTPPGGPEPAIPRNTQPTSTPNVPNAKPSKPTGIYQDVNGQWRRPNGQFASKAEIQNVLGGKNPTTPSTQGSSLTRGLARYPKLSKLMKGGGSVLSLIGGAAVTMTEWSNASDRLSSANQAINNAQPSERYSGIELERRRIAAQNRAAEEKAGAVGAGVGTFSGGIAGGLAGAEIGAMIGSAAGPLGTLVGGAIGGIVGGVGGAYFGEKYGNKAGRSMAIREDDDTINRHLNDINKGDEEDNIRRIVLPIESIDYNVSLIANRMGVVSASPARGNIYFEAEAKGEINPIFDKEIASPHGMPQQQGVAAQGQPLSADHVNEVDAYVMRTSQMYQPKGPISLNIGGSIELNLKGTSIGNITADDFMDMLNHNPHIMRELVDKVVERLEINENGVNKTFDNNAHNSWGVPGYLSYTR